MQRCPSCGAETEDATAVCPSCGLSLEDATASFAPIVEGEETVEPLPAGGPPMLVVRKGPEVGERFHVDQDPLTIGRDPSNTIFLNDITVSRCHARLRSLGGEISIEDSGSLNGTYVNGVSVDRAVLRPGDTVQIGRFQMVFLAGGAE